MRLFYSIYHARILQLQLFYLSCLHILYIPAIKIQPTPAQLDRRFLILKWLETRTIRHPNLRLQNIDILNNYRFYKVCKKPLSANSRIYANTLICLLHPPRETNILISFLVLETSKRIRPNMHQCEQECLFLSWLEQYLEHRPLCQTRKTAQIIRRMLYHH